MERRPLIAITVLLCLAASRGNSQETDLLVNRSPLNMPEATPLAPAVILPAQAEEKKNAPGDPKKDAPAEPKKDAANQPNKEPETPDTNLFAQTPSSSGEAPLGRNPRMIGDFPGYFSVQTIAVPVVQTIQTFQNITQYTTVTQTSLVTQTITVPAGENSPITATVTTPVQHTAVVSTTTRVPVTLQVPTTVNTVVVVPEDSRGPFKIAENESAQPEDRVYLTGNFYSNLQGPPGAPNASTSVQQTTYNGQPAAITTTTPGVASPQYDLYRQVLGFEKIVWDGMTSVGIRIPLLEQIQRGGNFGSDDIGDVSVIFKHVIWGELTGNLVSGGLVITAPTGPDIDVFSGTFHDFLIQPFVGGRFSFDRLTAEGFVSLAVPTDARDVTVLFNDYFLCYNLYQGSADNFLSSVSPTVEAHLTTPLNHQNGTNGVVIPNLLAITTGVHFGIYGRTTLTLAVSTPLTGPHLYDIEAMAYLNYNF